MYVCKKSKLKSDQNTAEINVDRIRMFIEKQNIVILRRHLIQYQSGVQCTLF